MSERYIHLENLVHVGRVPTAADFSENNGNLEVGVEIDMMHEAASV